MTHDAEGPQARHDAAGRTDARPPAGSRAARILARIDERFAPLHAALVDESARHAGHAGVREAGPSAAAGETHYALHVVSAAFSGLSRVQRSRLVHTALDAEFRQGLHALSLTLRTPEEQDRPG